jgi:hypothetical protein
MEKVIGELAFYTRFWESFGGWEEDFVIASLNVRSWDIFIGFSDCICCQFTGFIFRDW